MGGDPDFDWSTATLEELRIKFGILHAMYLPDVAEEDIPKSITSVNTFRFLFKRVLRRGLPAAAGPHPCAVGGTRARGHYGSICNGALKFVPRPVGAAA